MINPMVVEGQISGGVVQGIGAVSVRAVRLRRLRAIPLPRPCSTTSSRRRPTCRSWRSATSKTRGQRPGGYKGVGEGGAIGAVPAVRNAISDALGVDIYRPVRPCDVLAIAEPPA